MFKFILLVTLVLTGSVLIGHHTGYIELTPSEADFLVLQNILSLGFLYVGERLDKLIGKEK